MYILYKNYVLLICKYRNNALYIIQNYISPLWNAIQNSFQECVIVWIFRDILKHQEVLLPCHKCMEVSWFLCMLLSASVTTWCFISSFTSRITLCVTTGCRVQTLHVAVVLLSMKVNLPCARFICVWMRNTSHYYEFYPGIMFLLLCYLFQGNIIYCPSIT